MTNNIQSPPLLKLNPVLLVLLDARISTCIFVAVKAF